MRGWVFRVNVSGKTKVCALIGDPVEHSLSPTIQNAAFHHLNLDYIYVAFNVQADQLKNAILGVKGLGIHGLNVTMPHKINIIKYLDELDETAEKVGSVNTVLNRSGRLIGYTTDGIGALNALKYAGSNPSGKKIVVLGAGGASRSICFTLAEYACELIILNRTLKKAVDLANNIRKVLGERTSVRAAVLTNENLERELKNADILINATSVGMKPNDAYTPVNRSFLHRNLTVFDIVYEPLETRLLREARLVGAKTIDGLSMLIHQGAVSFEIWTNVKAPIKVMREAALRKIREAEKQ